MKVRVKFFAILRERAGVAEVVKQVEEGSTVGDLWGLVQEDFPALASPGLRLLFALNRSYVGGEATLHEGDEVVFIPPVSGG